MIKPYWGLLFAVLGLPLAAQAAEVPAPPPKARPVVADRACEARVISPADGEVPEAFVDCASAPVMVRLQDGKLVMGNTLGTGSVYEKPPHNVQVRAFAISRYEITRVEWAACVRATGCPALESVTGEDTLPVTGVTWEQAKTYTGWLSRRTGHRYRLPSEAEWEYAARGGTVSQYPWGSDADDICQRANGFDVSGRRVNPQWFWGADCDDGNPTVARVGQFPPNAWGLHDMIGNVWEWVEDCWHSDYTDAPTDGRAWVEPGCRKRVNRGGGWGNPPSSLRVTTRDGDPADARSDGLGFRVARDLEP